MHRLSQRAGISLFGNNKRWLVLRGLMGIIGLSGIFSHSASHSPASATVIQYFSPVFTVLLALMFMKERVHKWQWFFLGSAPVGIVMVKGFDPRVSLGHVGTGVDVCMLRCCGLLGHHEMQGH